MSGSGDSGSPDPAQHAVFEQLSREHRVEIRLHCYRMLGSLSDAEDLTQETFTRAWRARAELADPTALRPWLYRIATNACLDALRRRKRERRLWSDQRPADAASDLGPPDLEADWLDPMPDAMAAMADVAADTPGPQANYEQAEAVRLAFLACVQRLPARQRAIFLLHDVMGWSAAEIAAAFSLSAHAANSLLQRARRAFEAGYRDQPKWSTAGASDMQLANRYAAAFESRELDVLVALLHSDANLHMPPYHAWFAGRSEIRTFLARVWPHYGGFRARVFRANGRSAIAIYACSKDDDTWNPHSFHVLEIAGGAIASIMAFVGPMGPALFARAGLPAQPVGSLYGMQC